MPGSRRKPINALPDDDGPSLMRIVDALLVLLVILAVAAVVAHVAFGVDLGIGSGDQGGAGPPKSASGGPTGATGAGRNQTARGGPDVKGRSVGPLGYPAAATRNTTRISADDPADLAAAAALAAFPASGPGAPPPAVTITSSDDWQAGIAAASLAASPIGAPILIAPSGVLSSVVQDTLDQLDPVGAPGTGAYEGITGGDVAPPDGYRTRRLTGDDATLAAEVADLRFELTGEAPRHFVVVSDQDPGFAMPAAAWAARSGDPVLYTDRDSIPQATLDELGRKRNKKVPVYVLGPTSSVSKGVLEDLADKASTVKRVGGDDPVEAAIELARYVDGSFGWNLNDPGHGFLVARDDQPLDAVAATALSTGGTWPAMLLTDRADELPQPLLEYLLDIKPGYTTDPTRALYNHVWIIGGEAEIDLNQQAQIDDAAELVPVQTLNAQSGE